MADSSSLWRHRDFLKLWGGQTVSVLGTEVTQLALPLAAILTLHASAFEVAVLTAVEVGPLILFGLPAGVWVDRLRRRPLLIVSDLGRVVVVGSVPIAYALGALSIWQLYVVGFAAGTLAVPFDLAYLSYVPTLVGRARIAEANAKLEGSRSAMHVVGPGVAGLLVGALKAPVAIAVDAASFLVSAVALLLVRGEEPEPPARAERRPMRADLADGLRHVFRDPYLRSLVGCTGAWNLFSTMGTAILLVYLVRRLGFDPTTVGTILTLGSIGALAGAVSAGRVARRLGLGPTIVGSALGYPVFMLLIPAAPRGVAAPFVVAAILGAAGTGMIYNVNQLSLRQAITPPRLHGRMNAVVRVMYWGGVPLGALLGGALAAAIGLRTTLFVSGALAAVSYLPLLRSPVRTLRQIPPEAADEEPPAAAVAEPLQA